MSTTVLCPCRLLWRLLYFQQVCHSLLSFLLSWKHLKKCRNHFSLLILKLPTAATGPTLLRSDRIAEFGRIRCLLDSKRIQRTINACLVLPLSDFWSHSRGWTRLCSIHGIPNHVCCPPCLRRFFLVSSFFFSTF